MSGDEEPENPCSDLIRDGDKFDNLTEIWLKEYKKEYDEYDKSLKIDSKNTRIWFKKGTLFYSHRAYEEALQCFEKVFELDPECINGRLWKGLSLLSLERTEEGLDVFNELLLRDPTDDFILAGKYLSLIKLGRIEEAKIFSKEYGFQFPYQT